jgi:hypothetical protein
MMLYISLPLPIMFLLWVTSGEYKWVTLAKRRCPAMYMAGGGPREESALRRMGTVASASRKEQVMGSRKRSSAKWALLATILASGICGCGSTVRSVITVSVSPSSASLLAGTKKAITATVANDSKNQGVTLPAEIDGASLLLRARAVPIGS